VNLVQLVRSALIGLALSWLLAACGPTGGGTGTGESVFTPADFGARPASACSAPFAAALACENVSTASLDVAQLPGTHDVSFAGMADSGPVTLTLSGNRATVQSRCPGPGFDGSWGVRADGQGRYFGSWSGAGTGGHGASAPSCGCRACRAVDDALLAAGAGRRRAGAAGVRWSLRRVAAVPTEAPACP
jgi:hypothetical protein